MMEKSISFILQKILHVGELIEEDLKNQSDFKDLTPRQLYCIELIKEANQPSLSELATKMNIAKASISVMMNRLERQDLIYKVNSPYDRRTTYIHLTEKGEKVAILHTFIHDKIADFLTSDMTSAEKKQLTVLLNKSIYSLNRYFNILTD